MKLNRNFVKFDDKANKIELKLSNSTGVAYDEL